jgi:hypothetical protein
MKRAGGAGITPSRELTDLSSNYAERSGRRVVRDLRALAHVQESSRSSRPIMQSALGGVVQDLRGLWYMCKRARDKRKRSLQFVP